jgi:ABC-type bacteriocin/lantibiotic exporter with double-glycine peptidase domain
MPQSLYGYIVRYTGIHQVGLAALAILVFLLSSVPLELQRRIVNDLSSKASFHALLLLAGTYAAVALVEQVLKLLLNVYRGWVAEDTVRALRRTACNHTAAPSHTQAEAGVEVALVLEEAEPIGGFTALSISEPILQVGILVSVVGYMLFLQPELALIGLGFFIPQIVLVPLLQHAINRRAGKRIVTKREMSATIVNEAATAQHHPIEWAIQRIFRLNMGIYRLKYLMNLVMNVLHHLSVAATFGIGGWMVLNGRIEVGTVVAMVGGFAKLNDPWGDIVNWAREYSVVRVKYLLFREAAAWLTGAPGEGVLPGENGSFGVGMGTAADRTPASQSAG